MSQAIIISIYFRIYQAKLICNTSLFLFMFKVYFLSDMLHLNSLKKNHKINIKYQ